MVNAKPMSSLSVYVGLLVIDFYCRSNSLVSSAKRYVVLVTLSGRSLINKINEAGPSTHTCRIPLRTCVHSDESPFTSTRCRMLSNNFWIQSNNCLFNPYLLNFRSNLWCGTRSKALLKSR